MSRKLTAVTVTAEAPSDETHPLGSQASLGPLGISVPRTHPKSSPTSSPVRKNRSCLIPHASLVTGAGGGHVVAEAVVIGGMSATARTAAVAATMAVAFCTLPPKKVRAFDAPSV